jgi:hypothetical protein
MLAAMADTEPTMAGRLGEIRRRWHRFSSRYAAVGAPARAGGAGVRPPAVRAAVPGVEWSGGRR